MTEPASAELRGVVFQKAGEHHRNSEQKAEEKSNEADDNNYMQDSISAPRARISSWRWATTTTWIATIKRRAADDARQ